RQPVLHALYLPREKDRADRERDGRDRSPRSRRAVRARRSRRLLSLRDTAVAMTEEKIERVRATYDAFNRGDFDAAMETVHPDVEFVPPGGQQAMRGAARVRAWMEPDAFES